MGTPGSKTSEVRPLMRGGLGPGPENSRRDTVADNF